MNYHDCNLPFAHETHSIHWDESGSFMHSKIKSTLNKYIAWKRLHTIYPERECKHYNEPERDCKHYNEPERDCKHYNTWKKLHSL